VLQKLIEHISKTNITANNAVHRQTLPEHNLVDIYFKASGWNAYSLSRC